ncbi:MAG TPA: hypothetical protein VNZ64_07585 [Candidatus Acidoferrum sp.]|nr:hypothetical protein [Candidatus Acidoferrum sp.]
MIRCWRWILVLVCGAGIGPGSALGQIDPVKRELIQLGYNAAFEGHAPLSAYAFYYRNAPDFPGTNMTLRLAVAPTYLDSELGFRNLLGENTDLGIGIAGGGYADSYYEIRRGKYLPEESFDGYGGGGSVSLYHLFNPGYQIPLNGVLRGTARFVTYEATDNTDPRFQMPAHMGIFSVRSGLRWGGREPTLFPALAMELSVWYEGQFRTEGDIYGFGDRKVEPNSHLFWGEAFLAYTMPKWKHQFSISLLAGTSIDADRFSAYRLGGFLPMVSEFPLSLPGYYYQELSAKRFFLAGGNYTVPLDPGHRWNLNANAATALVNYLPGLEQPHQWNSGVGGGVFYTSPSWRVMVGYGYGIDAIRSNGRGSHTIGFLLQLDLTPAKEAFFKAGQPGPWRGIQQIFGVFGS